MTLAKVFIAILVASASVGCEKERNKDDDTDPDAGEKRSILDASGQPSLPETLPNVSFQDLCTTLSYVFDNAGVLKLAPITTIQPFSGGEDKNSLKDYKLAFYPTQAGNATLDVSMTCDPANQTATLIEKATVGVTITNFETNFVVQADTIVTTLKIDGVPKYNGFVVLPLVQSGSDEPERSSVVMQYPALLLFGANAAIIHAECTIGCVLDIERELARSKTAIALKFTQVGYDIIDAAGTRGGLPANDPPGGVIMADGGPAFELVLSTDTTGITAF